MKTEAKHTPGPWEIDSCGLPIVINGSNQEGPDCVCTIPINDASHTYAYPGITAMSNACLIAAAPELLAALSQIEAMLTQPVQYTGIRNGASCDVLRADCASAVKVARAAISKATGGEI